MGLFLSGIGNIVDFMDFIIICSDFKYISEVFITFPSTTYMT